MLEQTSDEFIAKSAAAIERDHTHRISCTSQQHDETCQDLTILLRKEFIAESVAEIEAGKTEFGTMLCSLNLAASTCMIKHIHK